MTMTTGQPDANLRRPENRERPWLPPRPGSRAPRRSPRGPGGGNSVGPGTDFLWTQRKPPRRGGRKGTSPTWRSRRWKSSGAPANSHLKYGSTSGTEYPLRAYTGGCAGTSGWSRTGPRTWGLRSWRLPEYQGMVQEMRQVLQERGEMPLSELFQMMASAYGAGEETLRAAAAKPDFVTANGTIRLNKEPYREPHEDTMSFRRRRIHNRGECGGSNHRSPRHSTHGAEAMVQTEITDSPASRGPPAPSRMGNRRDRRLHPGRAHRGNQGLRGIPPRMGRDYADSPLRTLQLRPEHPGRPRELGHRTQGDRAEHTLGQDGPCGKHGIPSGTGQ